jgi:hypothetical protein
VQGKKGESCNLFLASFQAWLRSLENFTRTMGKSCKMIVYVVEFGCLCIFGHEAGGGG